MLGVTMIKNTRFNNLAIALKRANYFCPENPAPFTSLTSPLGNNYARMFYEESPYSSDSILMLDQWAMALNRAADSQKIQGDQNLIDAFASFKSNLWFDVAKLLSSPGA
jgi:hypothetical protein